jgi:formylmethanofuran dehydrogenase subunit C
MSLQLQLRTPSTIPLEVDAVTIERARELSLEDVRRLPVQRGNQTLPLAEFFDVDGSAQEDETIVWSGSLEKVKLIGARMARGRMLVEGSAGMHAGAEMTGGELEIRGDVGDWLGAEMHGGRIHVRGAAGHLVGSVYRGGRIGMTGGEILIEGSAGGEIGHSMRRGLIVIGGDVGDFVGVSLIAGTILVFGRSGLRHGAGMKRGTLGLFGPEPPEMLPSFRDAGEFQPLFLALFARRLQQLGFAPAETLRGLRCRRFCGDLLEQGLGEVRTPAA